MECRDCLQLLNLALRAGASWTAFSMTYIDAAPRRASVLIAFTHPLFRSVMRCDGNCAYGHDIRQVSYE